MAQACVHTVIHGHLSVVTGTVIRQDASDLAVVTSQGIEVFRLSFDQRAAKSQRTFPTPVRVCWLEPSAATTLVCTGARTLQPFDFRRRNAKLPRFDLVLGRGQSIEPGDVALMTIYDCTYCIHADGSNGKVSLRNVTNLEKGTPEHDIVIDISDQDTPLGPLRLSVVDNLLIVHCLERTRHVFTLSDLCMFGPIAKPSQA